MELFPLFLKLEGRTCLVVGAGRVAESKIESLVRSGANVRVVAPEATEAVREAARSGAIVWEQRSYRPGDLAGAFIVVAATSSPKLHAEIFQQLLQRHRHRVFIAGLRCHRRASFHALQFLCTRRSFRINGGRLGILWGSLRRGSNGTCGGTYYCTGLPGYDGPTGLGTPNGIKAFH